MPHALLHLTRYFLLALIWLFFLYASRMVFVEVRRTRAEKPATPATSPLGADRSVALKLKVIDPPQRRGRVFELGEEVTVGRSPGCAVALEDDTFTSTVHARVFRRQGELWLSPNFAISDQRSSARFSVRIRSILLQGPSLAMRRHPCGASGYRGVHPMRMSVDLWHRQ